MTVAAHGQNGDARWRSQAFDVLLALLATCAELALLLDDGSASVSAILLTVATGVALTLRRAAPLIVLAVTLAAATAIVAIDEAPGGISVLLALYTVAAHLERRVSLAALVPTAAIVTVLSVVAASGDRVASLLVGALAAAPLTVGIWGLGAYVQTRRQYARELEARASRLERERDQLARIAVYEERTSIARELHDIVAHSVSVMLVGVRGARDVLQTSPDVADDTLARVEASGERSLAELRRILGLLRSPEQRPESRPQPTLANLDELIAEFHAAGLPVSLVVAGEPQSLAEGVELSVYRVVQEALTNVLKHTRPTHVSVTLAFRNSGLELEIVDDGVRQGEHLDANGGQGIVGMRERVALLGGELETGRRAGGGFRVAARVPIDDV
jgi:signal transduction histidine kinase